MAAFFVGTKAQFIKLAPVIKEFLNQGYNPVVVNLGQHGETFEQLKKNFPFMNDVEIVNIGPRRDLTKIIEIFLWMLSYVRHLARPGKIGEEIKGNKIAIVHGDTLSTIISFWLAKRLGLKVAHIEAGLRSRNIFHPFPEELIRYYCMKRADYLFAPGGWAIDNLKEMNVKGEIYNSRGNTITDAIRLIIGKNRSLNESNYCLATFHRTENIFSRKNLNKIINALERVSNFIDLKIVLHKTTESRVRKLGLYDKIQSLKRVTILKQQNYSDFIYLLARSSFVLSDGGSIQEECAALGKPCLIMRKKTERPDGIGQNATLWNYDDKCLESFLEGWSVHDGSSYQKEDLSQPSKNITNELIKISREP